MLTIQPPKQNDAFNPQRATTVRHYDCSYSNTGLILQSTEVLNILTVLQYTILCFKFLDPLFQLNYLRLHRCYEPGLYKIIVQS